MFSGTYIFDSARTPCDNSVYGAEDVVVEVKVWEVERRGARRPARLREGRLDLAQSPPPRSPHLTLILTPACPLYNY